MMSESNNSGVLELDAVIVGAGFAGLYMLHRLRDKLGLKARIFEAADGAGGTWYWNRYPGARVDIPSLQYSYQFDEKLQQEWEWKERYAPQSELLDYVNHVIERFELAPDIQYNSRVESAVYDEQAKLWNVKLSTGQSAVARFCIMATGCLSAANTPDFKGRDSFTGEVYHTGQWPHEGVDFTGKRVGIIGTGSSAVQSIPEIAKQAEHLTVFQRTPNFSVPAHNQPLDPQEQQRVKADYKAFREAGKQQVLAWDIQPNPKAYEEMSKDELKAELEARWQIGGLFFYGALADMLINKESNDAVAEFVREKIRSKVKDPAVAELLTPTSIIGCKRICADTNYYETYNRDNVLLVDVSKQPIDEITPRGVRVGDTEYEFDAIVFATGFDAMTGALNRIDIRGREGLPLKKKWEAGPRTYLGLQTVGFPNMFMISGPGSPSVLTNMITSIEQHVEFVSDTIEYLRDKGLAEIEAQPEAEDAWVDHVNEVAGSTLLLGCNSWYLGANVPGKPRVFMPYLGFPEYKQKCDEVMAAGLEGFALRAA